MGLLSLTYAAAHPIEAQRLAAAIEASTGERTKVTREAQGYAAVSCRWISGVAELITSDGRVTVEVMLPASEYFLAHVEAALASEGARRLERDGSQREAGPPNPLVALRWRSLPLGQRLAGGWVGQALLVLAMPLIWCGFAFRAGFRRLRGAG